MITNELALKLKDAGFPQFTFDALVPLRGDIYFSTGQSLPYGHPKTNLFIKMGLENGEEPSRDLAYAPTLSELIEACGEEFGCLTILKLEKKYWIAYSKIEYQKSINSCYLSAAYGQKESTKYSGFTGSSPEEAVANLWLSINKKQ